MMMVFAGGGVLQSVQYLYEFEAAPSRPELCCICSTIHNDIISHLIFRCCCRRCKDCYLFHDNTTTGVSRVAHVSNNCHA